MNDENRSQYVKDRAAEAASIVLIALSKLGSFAIQIGSTFPLDKAIVDRTIEILRTSNDLDFVSLDGVNAILVFHKNLDPELLKQSINFYTDLFQRLC